MTSPSLPVSEPVHADLNGNKQLARQFLDDCFNGRMEAAVALLSPEATWWVLGNPDKIRVSGTRDRTRIVKFLQGVRRLFPEGMRVTFEGITAEGERVAIEASAEALMANGQPYANRYHFLIRVVDGRVLSVREYIDTQYVYEVQGGS